MMMSVFPEVFCTRNRNGMKRLCSLMRRRFSTAPGWPVSNRNVVCSCHAVALSRRSTVEWCRLVRLYAVEEE